MRFFFLIFFLSFSPFMRGTEDTKPKVLVSVAPQRYLVEQIAGDALEVALIVPAKASPHTYEPTAKQLVHCSGAQIWFRIGESFETKVLKVFGHNMQVVDAREGISLLTAKCTHGHHAEDLHIWLSPKLLKKQAQQITKVLCQEFPDNSTLWKKNAKALLQELDALDKRVATLLKGVKNRCILVSHPAFAYFCQDYGLTQLSIEVDGKEPTPKELTHLLSRATKEGIGCIFAQEQYSRQGAKRMAEVLGVEIAFLDPYAENVIDNIKTIATAFYDSI